MKKRLISLVFAMAILLTLTISPASALFTNPNGPDYDANAQQASEDHSTPPIPYIPTPTGAAARYRAKYPDFPSATNMCTFIGVTPTAQLNGLRQPLTDARVLNLKTPSQPFVGDHGAYYYVQSVPSSTYSAAFARVALPQVGPQDGRCAFISMGVAGQLGGVDMGIIYTNGGWCPYFYDVAEDHFYAEFGTHSTVLTGEATYAVLNTAVVDAATVQWSVTFQDADGKDPDTFWLQSPIRPGNLSTDADGKVVCSFYRFASHWSDADTATTMEKGAFTGCQLYDGSTYVPWGMEDDTAASIWTVNPTCVDLAYDGTTDIFSIRY